MEGHHKCLLEENSSDSSSFSQVRASRVGPQVISNGDKFSVRGFTKCDLMSTEELKIRNELEIEVERNLEEEIKDGIYHLALRLHRLYQHQNERERKDLFTGAVEHQSKTNNTAFTELTLTIKMEGGFKIEIQDRKKSIGDRGRKHNPGVDHTETNAYSSEKKFEWARTLRSGSNSISSKKKTQSPIQHPELIKHVKVQRNNRSASSGSNGAVHMKDKKLLQLGWRN